MRKLLVALMAMGLIATVSGCSSGDDTTGEAVFATSTSEFATTTTGTPATIVTLPTTTTTVTPSTTTTSSTTTSTVPSTTTTTLAPEVLESMEGSTADTLEELPLTGFEPVILALSLVALIAGTWLVRWSGAWQRLRRLQARAWRRPDAPQALIVPERAWPPTALDLSSPSNVEFRRLAHHLADVYGVSVMGGIDAYATRVAATFDPAADPAQLSEAVAELAARDDWVAPLDRWTLHLALEVARLNRR